MLATQITDHIAQALARFIRRYQKLPPQGTLVTKTSGSLQASRILGFMAACTDQAQILENVLFALSEETVLFDGATYPSFGAQLDGIGALVNLSRNGLLDDEYLVFILGKIVSQYSDGTLTDFGNAVSLLFGVNEVVLLEFFPGEVSFEVPASQSLPSSLIVRAVALLASVLEADVAIGYGAIYPQNSFRFEALIPNPNDEVVVVPVNAFAFTYAGGSQVGGGFGDANNQSSGGPFASIVYIGGGFGDANNPAAGGGFATELLTS